MKTQVEQMPATFVPVKLEIILETKKERDLLIKLMAKSITVPKLIQQEESTDWDGEEELGALMYQLYLQLVQS